MMMIEGEVRVKFKLNPVKASHYFLLPTTSSKEVRSLPFYEWCEGLQVEIQSMTGIGTIELICVVRADDERYANKFCLK